MERYDRWLVLATVLSTRKRVRAPYCRRGQRPCVLATLRANRFSRRLRSIYGRDRSRPRALSPVLSMVRVVLYVREGVRTRGTFFFFFFFINFSLDEIASRESRRTSVHVGVFAAEPIVSRGGKGSCSFWWRTRPSSSGVRRQLKLPARPRTLESVSGS